MDNNLEIERKFLVTNMNWTHSVVETYNIMQGYILTKSKSVVRVRILNNQIAFLTLKDKSNSLVRHEYEYQIPLNDAKEIYHKMCDGFVEKYRFYVPYEQDPSLKWEIDWYKGPNIPLFTAEIELPDKNKDIVIPNWIGKEITYDDRYKNCNLALKPFCEWENEE